MHYLTKHATEAVPQWASDALRDLNLRYRRLGSIQQALGLTDREMQVALLIHPDGHSNKAIAMILGNSSRTIEHHRRIVLAKLAVDNSIQAALKLERSITSHENAINGRDDAIMMPNIRSCAGVTQMPLPTPKL